MFPNSRADQILCARVNLIVFPWLPNVKEWKPLIVPGHTHQNWGEFLSQSKCETGVGSVLLIRSVTEQETSTAPPSRDFCWITSERACPQQSPCRFLGAAWWLSNCSRCVRVKVCSLVVPAVCWIRVKDAKTLSLAEENQTFTFRIPGRGRQAEVTVVMRSSVLLRLSRQIV